MSEAFDPITYTYGVAFEQPSEPTREGYTFDGWYQNDTLTTPYTGWDGLRAQNHSIYARWSINQYTIITNEMGAPEMDDIVANYGAAVQQPSEISDYEGFLFVGWYLDEELTQEVTWPIIMPVGGITIYAKWASSENMVTVSFETNGGTPAIIDQNLPAGSTVTKPSNPSKNGFGLEGWYSNVELTEKWNFDVNTVNEDVTLYAKWVALVVMRQSDFGETNSNSSTYGNFYIDTVENGSSDPLPNGTSSWSRAGGNYNGTSWNHIRFGQNSTIPRLGDLETSNSTSNQAVHASDPNSYVATRFNLDSVIKIDMIFDLVKAGTTIHLQTSTNGTNWTAFDSITVTDAISSQTTLTFNVYSESAQYYRFVLVNATTSTNGSLAHLYTITFYGFPS